MQKNEGKTYKKARSYELWRERMQNGNAFPRRNTDATWGFQTSPLMKRGKFHAPDCSYIPVNKILVGYAIDQQLHNQSFFSLLFPTSILENLKG